METEGLPKETAPGICYTLWLFENDITEEFTHVLATIPGTPSFGVNQQGTLRAVNGVDGYSCDASTKHYYHSNGLASPVYFELRSPITVKVSKILVKPRTSGAGPYFDNIQARVGNNEGIANFHLNQQIGNTATYSPPDEFIVYDGSSNPITGKVVILKRVGTLNPTKPYLAIEELIVIGEVV